MRKLSFLVLSTVVVMLFCCGNQHDVKATENGEEKKVVTFDPPDSYGDFKSDWEKVPKFESEGKPRSALEVVEKIYAKAQADKNAPQLIKTIVYKTKYVLAIGEKDFPKIIKDFETETMKAQFPADAIMKSMLAEIYWNYFNQNRYRFYQRTQTAGSETEDIATWSLKTISDKISKLHLEALSRKADLQGINIALFDEIVVKKGDIYSLKIGLP